MLFEFNAEMNPLFVAQGCLLLSHQATTWLAIAIRSAITIGAHRPLKKADPDSNKKKRLWWSILIRDRAISLALRRSILVQPPLLDTAIQPPCESDFQDEIHHSRVYQPRAKKRFIKMLRAQFKLSLILTELLANVPSDQNQLDGFHPFDSSTKDSRVLVDARGKLCDWLGDPDGFILLEDPIDEPLRQPTSPYRSLILLQFQYV